jgi:hypothetical protein
VTLKELGLPVWEDIVGVFFRTNSMEVAKAIAHWVHTPDCSTRARELIRDALKLDGSTKVNEDAQHLFKCAACCDSRRAFDNDQGRHIRALKIQLEAAKSQHCFCPDCRDKVRDEECLRCQVQRLTRKLRKYDLLHYE